MMMSQKLGNYKQLNESITRGGMRVRLCQYCHGKDGNSKKDSIPNLAAQNPVYLLTQFEYFRTGVRKNRVMNDLARGLTDEERINIALYYASQDVKRETKNINVNSGDYKQGSQLYKQTCISCHGEKGYGKQSLPRIAGQNYAFISKTLLAYKNKTGLRPDSPMIAVASALSDREIMSISTYASSMK